MVKVCIGYGSNVPDARQMISRAAQLVAAAGLKPVAESYVYVTSSPYSNMVAVYLTDMPYEQLVSLTKLIEQQLGRTPQMKLTGEVPIDLDVVIYAGTVVRPADYSAPYFQQGYRQIQPFLDEPALG